MFTFFYNLSLSCYLIALKAAAPFHAKARKWIEGRENIFEELQQKFESVTSPVAWFHCASLGEFEQARPVIEGFREQHPGHKILLTFFSPSGYEIRKNYSKADFIFYLPLDTETNAEAFLDITKPKVAFFVKYEFWFHYLNELHNRSIPFISFSAIFRPQQVFFKDYGQRYLELLKSFSRIFVQDEESLLLLKKHGVEKVQTTGDTRFDRVKDIATNRKEIEIVKSFKQNKLLIVIGSAWEEDLKVFLPVLTAYEDLKIIVAPHELPESILEFTERSSPSSVRFSKADAENVKDKQVLIIDNIGMLSSLYYYAEFACIGGAFGKGLHNTLEAAVYGMPLFFGPMYQKFKEARDLIKRGAAFSVKDSTAFQNQFDPLFKDSNKRQEVAKKSAEYVNLNLGASEKILSYTRQLFKA